MPTDEVWLRLGEVADFLSNDVERRADAVEVEMNAVALLTGMNVLHRRTDSSTQRMPNRLLNSIGRSARKVQRAANESGSYADIQDSITELLTCALRAKAEFDHEQWLLSIANMGRPRPGQ